MKNNSVHFIRIVAAALLLLLAQPSRAQLQIERAQRDFQVRHHLVTGAYVQWPSCSGSQTPAPAFPKDGFYGDISKDPDKGVELVADLVEKFYFLDEIYDSFVMAPNGDSDLEGATEIAKYSLSDMQETSGEGITAQNYIDNLAIVSAQINKLRLVMVEATQVIDDTTDHKSTYGRAETGDCSAELACLAAAHTAAAWGGLETSVYQGCTLDHTCSGGLAQRSVQLSQTHTTARRGRWHSGTCAGKSAQIYGITQTARRRSFSNWMPRATDPYVAAAALGTAAHCFTSSWTRRRARR